jgi:tRNA pseudouridine38-40 synthase
MQVAATRMVGERDFAALGSDPHGRTIRRMTAVQIRSEGSLIEVVVTGNASLRRMVRSLVAVLVAVGRGEVTVEEVG